MSYVNFDITLLFITNHSKFHNVCYKNITGFYFFIYNNECSNITYLTTVNMLFVLVTEIMTSVNCTCVHFYCSHVNLWPLLTTPTTLIPFFTILSIVHAHKELCTCTC